jgi:choline dehydrogenase-like flavoprotein
MTILGAGTQQNTYDAIVIGSGISGGWAAKELSEKGLKTLVLERGRDVKHGDYPDRDEGELGVRRPHQAPNGTALARQLKQNAHRLHHPPGVRALVRRRPVDNPYSEDQALRLDARLPCRRSLAALGPAVLPARDLDFEANARRRASRSTGRSATPISRPGTTTPSVSPASAAQKDGLLAPAGRPVPPADGDELPRAAREAAASKEKLWRAPDDRSVAWPTSP